MPGAISALLFERVSFCGVWFPAPLPSVFQAELLLWCLPKSCLSIAHRAPTESNPEMFKFMALEEGRGRGVSSTDQENDSKCYCYVIQYVIVVQYVIWYIFPDNKELKFLCPIKTVYSNVMQFCSGSIFTQFSIKYENNQNRSKMSWNQLRKWQ